MPSPHYSPYLGNLDLTQYYRDTEPRQHDHIEMPHGVQFLQTVIKGQSHAIFTSESHSLFNTPNIASYTDLTFYNCWKVTIYTKRLHFLTPSNEQRMHTID